ncbi:MAG: glutamate-cysteine ligase family protein [Proteobacteria bacterium]|nr:glutamate-cysteine ligase family protein [Pseudomonadota bacterium]
MSDQNPAQTTHVPKGTRLSEQLLEQYLEENLFSPSSYPEERVGVEFEFFVSRQSEDNTLRGILKDPRMWSKGLLLSFAREKEWQILSENIGSEYLITGYKRTEGDLITFEPGKQIEISTRCYDDFHHLTAAVKGAMSDIREGLKNDECDLLPIGTYPFINQDREGSTPIERLLLPKARYTHMAMYYDRLGVWGEQLMKCTAATQVCLDVGHSHTEVCQRYVLGELLAPYTFAIFAFSPFFEGRLNGLACNRAVIVKHHDPKAAGIHHHFMSHLMKTKGSFDIQDVIQIYKKFLLASRVLVTRDYPQVLKPFEGEPFGHWLTEGVDGIFPTVHDLELQLHLTFPEVRAKGFFELRSPDAQSEAWLYAPVLFYMGLLLCPAVRQQAISLLMPYLSDVADHWDKASLGLRDPKIRAISQKIMELAILGLTSAEGKLSESIKQSHELKTLSAYARHFTFKGRTPADDFIDFWAKNNLGQEPRISIPKTLWQQLDDYWYHQQLSQ